MRIRPLHPFPIAIALGANLGPRRETFDQACQLLTEVGVQVVRRSRLYYSRPWGRENQPWFLNGAVAVCTHLRPLEILSRCLWVEWRLGRRREVHWGPRRIDLDLLFYGDLRVETPQLTLPHPGIGARDFVVAPLIDLELPPPHAVAPLGWEKLLAAIPESQRAIERAMPWK